MTQLRSVTCHMRSHSVTCHPTQVNARRLTPAMQAGTRFTYPAGMEGWVDLVGMIAPRPGVEPATFRSWVRRSTTAPPRHCSMLLTVCLHFLFTAEVVYVGRLCHVRFRFTQPSMPDGDISAVLGFVFSCLFCGWTTHSTAKLSEVR